MENRPNILCEGELHLGDKSIRCYVLEDGTRALSKSEMQRAMGVMGNEPNQRSSKRLDEILSSKAVTPFLSDDLLSSKLSIIEGLWKGTTLKLYDAMALPEICEVMLKVRDYAAENKIELGSRQRAVIAEADLIVRALARVGIIALVDEATGYQNEREHLELQKILGAYISDEILKWQLTFTDDFYIQVFRLWKIPFIPKYIKNKPSFIGKLTRKYIYEELPKGVVEKIQEKTGKTPKGNWKYKWHQSLTPDIGREHLKKQIIEVTALMSISESKEQFDALFQRKYHKVVQLELEFNEEPEPPSQLNKALKTALNYNPNKEDPR